MDIAILIPLVVACVALSYALYHVRMSQLPLTQRLDEQARLIVQLQQSISEHLFKRGELNDELAKCDSIILNLRRNLAEADATIADLQQKLAAKDSFIANLRGQITTSERGAIESKAFFQALSSVAYDLVFVLNEDRLIIALNKAAEAIFGQRNPIGEKLRDVLQSDELEDIISRALGEDESLEEQIILQNRHYRVRTQVMRYSSYRSLFIGVALQDITQLVRLNRARRDMVANISHELRTPIANIRLIIEGLFHEQNRPKRKASIASLRSIARETDTLLALLQELFDLSMIESGQAIMKLLPANLLEIVNDAVHRLSDQLEAKHLRVVNHVPLRLGVLCDYEQTRRVLANLIHNAIKWSPTRGDITISADMEGEDVVVSIFDNGPGVPDDQRERIFERFYQVDTSRSPGTGGTGLGLAICKHIVEAHGGRIWAEGNSKGNGGRFFFTLLSAGDVEVIPEMAHGQHDSLPFQQGAVERQFEGLGDDVMVELEDDGLNP